MIILSHVGRHVLSAKQKIPVRTGRLPNTLSVGGDSRYSRRMTLFPGLIDLPADCGIPKCATLPG